MGSVGRRQGAVGLRSTDRDLVHLDESKALNCLYGGILPKLEHQFGGRIGPPLGDFARRWRWHAFGGPTAKTGNRAVAGV